MKKLVENLKCNGLDVEMSEELMVLVAQAEEGFDSLYSALEDLNAGSGSVHTKFALNNAFTFMKDLVEFKAKKEFKEKLEQEKAE